MQWQRIFTNVSRINKENGFHYHGNKKCENMSECCIVFSDCIFLLLPLAWVTTMKLKTIRAADVSCKLLRVTLWILHKTNFSVLSHFLKFIYLHEVFIYAIHFFSWIQSWYINNIIWFVETIAMVRFIWLASTCFSWKN